MNCMRFTRAFLMSVAVLTAAQSSRKPLLAAGEEPRYRSAHALPKFYCGPGVQKIGKGLARNFSDAEEPAVQKVELTGWVRIPEAGEYGFHLPGAVDASIRFQNQDISWNDNVIKARLPLAASRLPLLSDPHYDQISRKARTTWRRNVAGTLLDSA